MKLSDLIAGATGGGSKKHQKVVLLVLAALGVFLLLLGHLDLGGPQPAVPVNALTVPEPGGSPPQARLQIQSEEEYLARTLEVMLQQISGAGRVDVVIRLEGSTTSEYALNQTTGRRVTDEKDPAGTTRVTTEVNDSGQLVVVRGDRGYEMPVVERETAPRVTGVLVVAEGARNPEIKAELFRATRVALGVEPHRILVLPKKF
ncbi:MAG: hypothetical protein AB1441_00160 [Bacillota bacterium]